jgi:hypothetical protein
MNLTVNVSQADIVKIDKGQPANSGPAEGFRGKGADTPKTEDRYGGFLQFCQPFRSDQ